MSYRETFVAMLVRDLKIACRQRAETCLPLIFFVMVVSLFPLAIAPAPAELEKIAPGIIWVASLLAVLLSLQALFRADFEDGSIAQMLLSPHPAALWIMARILAQWCITGLPLVIVAPVLGLLLHLDGPVIGVLCVSLLLGVPYLNMIGTIGVALTIGIRQAGALLALLVLPLYVPVLIFGAHAVTAAASRQPYHGQLLWLAALLALAAALSPFVIAFALRLSCGYR